MMPWMPAGVDMARMFETGVPGLREKLVTGFSEHIKLSKLIEKMICVLFSRKQAPADNTTTMSVIDDLDLQLCRWQESLPDCVKWNRWEPPTTSLPPSVAALL